MKKGESNISILRQANTGAIMETAFQIPVGNGVDVIEAKLTAPDVMRIWEESDLERRAVWAKAEAKGLVGKPIDRVEWEKELEQMEEKDRVEAEKNPPKDQAEQFARKFSGLNVIRSIIPKYLRNIHGEPLFGDEQEVEDFVKIMFYNTEILKAVSGAYVQLTKMMNHARDAVKN